MCRTDKRLTLLVLVGLVLVGGGCGQKTESVSQNREDQVVATETRTDQDTATKGSEVVINVINSPLDGNLPGQGTFALQDSESGAGVDSVTNDNITSGKANAGFLQIVSNTVTTGGTTPSVTGSSSGSGAGTQTASTATTQTPRQDIRPELSLSVPIGVALPGGLVDQNAVATGRGNTDATKTSTNSLTTAQLETMRDQAVETAQVLDFLANLRRPPSDPNQSVETDSGDQSGGN